MIAQYLNVQDLGILVFLISIVSLTTIFMYSFYYIMKRDRDIRRRENSMESRSSKIINQAHIDGESILSDALQNAKTILNQTEIFKNRLETDLKNSLDQEISEYRLLLQSKLNQTLSSYERVFIEVGKLYAQAIKQASQKLNEAQQKNIEQFKSLTQDESLTAKFYLQRKINDEFDKAKKQIDVYKEQERNKMEESLRKTLLKVSEDLFEGILTVEQQEKLIIKSLEQAKLNHIFDT